MALFYELELKIQTRMCNCASVRLLIKWQRTLPLIWLHLVGRNTLVPAHMTGLSRTAPEIPRSVPSL